MKELAKLHQLVEELRNNNLHDAADEIKKKADKYYIAWSNKKAQENNDSPEDEPLESEPAENNTKDLIQETLACLKMNLSYTQMAHWISKGESSYGDHLLYERLYEEDNEEIDAFAEKFIPLAEESFVNPIEVLKIASEKAEELLSFDKQMIGTDLAENVLKSEIYIIQKITDLYSYLKEKDILTMGADDLLMEMVNTHEGHEYLLKQRLK